MSEITLGNVQNTVVAMALGTVTASVGDTLFYYAIAPMFQNVGGTNASIIGMTVVQGLVGAASGALLFLGGQQVFASVVADDFVATTMFFNTLYMNSRTISGAASSFRRIISMATAVGTEMSAPVAARAPTKEKEPEPEMPMQPVMRNKGFNSSCGGRGRSSCAGLF